MKTHPPLVAPHSLELLASQTAIYLELIALLERLHRLLLDLVKDEFERIGLQDLTPVQALLLFHMGEQEVTAGELRSRGYYQGSNVSYNLKKLVESNYLHYERSMADRRSVRVRLSERGRKVRRLLEDLFSQHAQRLHQGPVGEYADLAERLRALEAGWASQIRYIY